MKINLNNIYIVIRNHNKAYWKISRCIKISEVDTCFSCDLLTRMRSKVRLGYKFICWSSRVKSRRIIQRVVMLVITLQDVRTYPRNKQITTLMWLGYIYDHHHSQPVTTDYWVSSIIFHYLRFWAALILYFPFMIHLLQIQ